MTYFRFSVWDSQARRYSMTIESVEVNSRPCDQGLLSKYAVSSNRVSCNSHCETYFAKFNIHSKRRVFCCAGTRLGTNMQHLLGVFCKCLEITFVPVAKPGGTPSY